MPGEVGELWAKGPMVVKGYWNRPEDTQETFVDGWVRTGDLARLDEEGFCSYIRKLARVDGIQGLVCNGHTGEVMSLRPSDGAPFDTAEESSGARRANASPPFEVATGRLALDSLPDEGRYNTLSGLVMMLLGRLPQTADRVECQGWRFEVVDMDGKRIDKVLAVRAPAEVSGNGTPGAAPGS